MIALVDLGAADGHRVIFERLAQKLQHLLAELGHFVEDREGATFSVKEGYRGNAFCIGTPARLAVALN